MVQKIFTICLLSAAFSSFAKADERFLFDLSLEELIATKFETASKYQETVSESPAISTVISREEIKGLGANNLVEVLERVVSVHMSGSNFFPQNVMSIRGDLLGHYDNHVLMLLNGRPMRESYAGGVNFSIYTAMPLSTIERIEIIRGPGSVLYGSNAYSGVVNIITRQEQNTRLVLTAGSFDSTAVEWTSNASFESIQLNWGVKLFDEAGWQFAAFDNNNVYNSTQYGETNIGVFTDLAYDNLKANLLYTSSKQNFMGASADWRSGPAVENRHMESERLFIDLSYNKQITSEWLLQSHFSHSNMDFDHYNYIGKAKDTTLDINGIYSASEKWNWLIGVSAWHQRVGSTARLARAPVPDFSANWYNIYSQLDYKPIDDLKIIAGLQWNKADSLNGKTVSRLGATYQISDTVGIKIMQAQAYRAAFGVETGFSLILTNPDGSIRGGLRGNPLLQSEQITTTDLQLFYQSKDLQLSATLFRSKLSELITRERAADNVIDFVNKGELTLRGWELENKYTLNEQWHLMLSYSYQHNETNDGINNFTTVPNHLFKGGVLYQSKQGISLGIFQNYVTESTDIAVQNPQVQRINPDADQYALWSLKLGIDLGYYFPSLNNNQVSVYGYNLGDEDIYHPDFIGKRINTLPARQGRSWYLTYSIGF